MTPVYGADAVARMLYELVLVAWLGSELWHGLGVFARRVRAGNGLGSFGQDRFSGPALILGIALAIGLGIRAAVFVPQVAITVMTLSEYEPAAVSEIVRSAPVLDTMTRG